MTRSVVSALNRRGFLKLAGIAAGAGLASGCAAAIPDPASAPTSAPAHDESGHTPAPQTVADPVQVNPFKVYDALLPDIDNNPVKKLQFGSSDEVLYIAKDVAFQAWPFGKTVPGPLVVVNEGDTVQFSLTNGSSAPHSIDFHAAQTPPNKNYISINPGASHSFDWKASYPGCFMYHCGTPFVLHHMAMGMYGASIVRPKGLAPADREFALVQSEFYLTDAVNGIRQTDAAKALTGIPDYVSFNGYANQYQENPLTAKVGELVRMWVMNAGPTHFSAFHVIGTIFEAAYQDGNPANKMTGMQTVNVYPGGGMMVEFRIPEAGTYPFVTHAFADASKGALGVLEVTNS